MLYAIDENGAAIRAQPNLAAKCKTCGSPVIAKCGEIKIWHWSHVSGADCGSLGGSTWNTRQSEALTPPLQGGEGAAG